MTRAFVWSELEPHSPGVEKNNVDARKLSIDAAGKGLYRWIRTHVQLPDLDRGFGVQLAKSGGSDSPSFERTYCKDQFRYFEPEELKCGLIAKPSVASSDDGRLTRETCVWRGPSWLFPKLVVEEDFPERDC